MTIENILDQLNPEVSQAVTTFTLKPTERNQCYIIGYLKAANQFGGLLRDHYTYLMGVVSNTPTTQSET